MKFALSVLLMLPVMASAATEIVYNRAFNNPYVPVKGIVTPHHICLDTKTDSLRVFVPEHTVETCDSVKIDHSDSTRPKQICVGRKNVFVPATTTLVSRFTTKTVCEKWNQNDSTRPFCVKETTKPSEYSNTFTQYTFEQADWRRERPINVQEKSIANCDN